MAALSQMESGTPDEDLGALSSSVGSSRNEDDLEDQSGGQGALSGQYDAETPEERAAYTGALTRLGQQPQTIDKAAQQKLDAIERAKQNILALSKYTPNPGQWANAAFGEPTNGGPGASLSNWYQGQLKGQQAQAEFARQQMGALNGLELAQGQVPWEAQSAQSAADERVLNTIANERTRREAIQERLQRAQEYVEERRARDANTAEYNRARVDQLREAAQQRADTASAAQEAGDWKEGDGVDPSTGARVPGMYWLPKNRAKGQAPEFFPGKNIQTTGAGSAAVATFREKLSVANQIYPNDPQKALDVAMGHKQADPDALDAAATKQAAQDYRALAATGQVPTDQAGAEQWLQAKKDFYKKAMAPLKPATASKTSPQLKNSPLKPAGAPASAASGAAPQPGSAAARASLGLPLGSAYNTKLKQWRDPAGKIYDEQGKPVAGGG
jgi:hypothetical protein